MDKERAHALHAFVCHQLSVLIVSTKNTNTSEQATLTYLHCADAMLTNLAGAVEITHAVGERVEGHHFPGRLDE